MVKKVKVKICGITNLEDALAVAASGADAAGFVFYKKSPRYISPQKTSQIIRQLPKGIIKIGVFVNARKKNIKEVAKLCRLDILQFHGNESPEFCREFKNYKVIKAFRIKGKKDLAQVTKYRTFAWLFDTYVPAKFGGSGKKFDWAVLTSLPNCQKPIFLSGGLNEKNVLQVIKSLRPDWVDVSSSVELEPGKKDHQKVKRFIRTAKSR